MAVVNVGITITAKNTAAAPMAAATKSVDKYRKSVGRAANSVRAFQFVVAGVVISSLAIWGKRIISVASQLQLLQIRLANVQGGVEAGNKQWNVLFNTFKRAPFELDKIIDGFVRLRAAGVSTQDATTTMKSLVDAVAVFGGTTAELQRATIGFQQVAGKGVLSMEELRQQIGESVPAAMALMSRAAGLTIAEFVEKVKNGMISASDAFKFFNAEAEKQFGGFAESLRFTISGAFQGLNSEVRNSIGKLFNQRTDLSARISAFLQILTSHVSDFINSIDQGTVDSFWKSFEGVATVLAGIVAGLASIVLGIGWLLGLMGNQLGAAAGAGLLFGKIGAMLFGVGPGRIIGALVTIGVLSAEIGKGGGDAGKKIEALYQAMQPEFESARAQGNIAYLEQLRLTFVEASNDIAEASRKNAGSTNLFEGIDEALEKTKTGLADQKLAKLKAGILGLGAEAAGLSDDLTTLFNRADVQSKNFLTPWLKTSDKMNLSLQKLQERVSVAAKNFREASSKFKKESIDTLPTGTPQEIAAQKEALALYNEEVGRTEKSISQLGGTAGRIRKAIDDLNKSSNEKFFDKMLGAFNKLKSSADLILGRKSQLQVALTEIGDKQDVVRKKWENIAEALERTGDVASGVLAEQIRDLLGDWIDLTTELQMAEARRSQSRIRQLHLETSLIKGQIKEEMRQLERSTDFGPSNMFGDDLTNEVLQRQFEMTQRISNLKKEILDTELRIAIEKPIGGELRDLEAQIEAYQKLIALLKKKHDTITEDALLEQQLWTDLGSIIENNVGSAIEGLITGTKTLKDAMLDMWRAAISAAAKYIVKLLIIKAIDAATGGTGIGSLVSSVFGFADGGAFKGNVKTFGNGDIIRGPTMFGLAGEAGTEAIMPLARGPGGKLGVMSQGGGGDTYNVNIQAIDQQTGAQFLLDNMPTIVAGMTQETSLNRGMRRGV